MRRATARAVLPRKTTDAVDANNLIACKKQFSCMCMACDLHACFEDGVAVDIHRRTAT